MAKTIQQLEKNVSSSFGYVKKDLLMMNDAVADVQEKLSRLSSEIIEIKEKCF